MRHKAQDLVESDHRSFNFRIETQLKNAAGKFYLRQLLAAASRDEINR
jgi:hypothetical protein